MTHGYDRAASPFGPGDIPVTPVRPRKRNGWKIALTAMLGSIALCVFGSVAVMLAGDDAQRRIALAPPSSAGSDVGEAGGRAATSAPVTKKPTADKVLIKDGTWEVSTEIQPGTYATTASVDGFGCYWARVRNFDGNLNAIIANGAVQAGARGRFTIKKSDRGVELSGGCAWERK